MRSMPGKNKIEQNSRHMITFPPDASIIVVYGCSDCHWRHHPAQLTEARQAAAFWNVQVLFDIHDCAKFEVQDPDLRSAAG